MSEKFRTDISAEGYIDVNLNDKDLLDLIVKENEKLTTKLAIAREALESISDELCEVSGNNYHPSIAIKALAKLDEKD